MYILIILLTMAVLPIVSISLDHAFHPAMPIVIQIARWFVFWAAGVRLGLAGVRQLVQPSFTAEHIFHISSDEALPLVRELGVANISIAVVALLSLAISTFVIPAALYAVIFYGIAGIRHVAEQNRSFNENIAMASDLYISVLFIAILVAIWVH
ncbi:MAG: hypothetical protein EPN75_13835 [Beijerinckiaceae bacterium]|nr:MAG: hypothetical protein EPN75_13835 [Beijerinckiaceae bacterium]